MIRKHSLITTLALAAAFGFGLAPIASAKMSNWKTSDGNRFKGEPAALLGPLAVFKTGKVNSTRVLLSTLSPADCVRFHNELNSLPTQTEEWANATSTISMEIYRAARRLDGVHLVQADLKGRPEPDYFILFSLVHDRKRTWDTMRYAIDDYKTLKVQFPTEFEAFFFGERMNDLAYLEVATEFNIPWLLPDLADRNRVDDIREILPDNGPALYFVTRNGVIVDGTASSEEADVKKMMASIRQLLVLDQPGAIGSMKDREYYYRAVQPAVFATGSSDPILVANPINADALRTAGVEKFSASVAVDAEGKVTGVEMSPDNTLTEELSASLSTALTRARFVPAVTDGKWVAGSYPYKFGSM